MKAWIAYVTGVVLLLAGGVAVAVPLWHGSDRANTTIRTAPGDAPGEPVDADLPAALSTKITADGIAPKTGSPVDGGTLVTATEHSVEGRDLETGAVRWSYERRNASLCDYVVHDGAVYTAWRKHSGCRDLTALLTTTGERKWYRSAELNNDVTLSDTNGLLVASDVDGMAAFNPDDNLGRWTYGQVDCTHSLPTLGDQGLALVVTCGDRTPQVVLLDPYTGHTRWKADAPGTLPKVVATDQNIWVLAVADGVPTLSRYDVDGKNLGAAAVAGQTYTDPERAGAIVENGFVYGWTDGGVYAVTLGGGRLAWTAAGSGPVGATPTTVLLQGLTELDPASGRVLRALGGTLPAGARTLTRVGGLLVATAPGGVTVLG